jgi:hypothetical protein
MTRHDQTDKKSDHSPSEKHRHPGIINEIQEHPVIALCLFFMGTAIITWIGTMANSPRLAYFIAYPLAIAFLVGVHVVVEKKVKEQSPPSEVGEKPIPAAPAPTADATAGTESANEKAPPLDATLFVDKGDSNGPDIRIIFKNKSDKQLFNIRFILRGGTLYFSNAVNSSKASIAPNSEQSEVVRNAWTFDRSKDRVFGLRIYYDSEESGKFQTYLASHSFELRARDLEEETCMPYKSTYREAKADEFTKDFQEGSLEGFQLKSGAFQIGIPEKKPDGSPNYFRVSKFGKTITFDPSKRSARFEVVNPDGSIRDVECSASGIDPRLPELHFIAVRWTDDFIEMITDGTVMHRSKDGIKVFPLSNPPK